MERDNKINKSLDELVNEDKKLSKMHTTKRKDGREDTRGGGTSSRTRERSGSGGRKRGILG